MITKNKTPLLFGTKVCSRKPPRPEMTLIAKGVLTLEPGAPLTFLKGPAASPLSGDLFADGDDEHAGECLYPSDFADFKLNAEVMLKGTCHVPGGRSVLESGVRFTVGSWSKALRVVGPRTWTGGLVKAFSDPRPFSRMPLSYANAFGGPGYAKNPAGKGHKTADLPTVELAAEPLRSPGDTPEPAGFGPLSPAWPQRAGKMGKEYGKKYVAERSPFYAEDFDWSYFSAAPPDQQWKGYLRGDEEISFHNLHPDVAVLSARLPAIRVRAFVKDDAGVFREVRMVLDTLFADLDEGELSLVWRGVDPVRETDLADVKTVLLVTEPLADPPGAAEGYRVVLEEFEQDPVGIEAAKQKLLALHELPGASGITAALGPEMPRQELIQKLVEGAVGPAQAAEAAGSIAAAGDADVPPTPGNIKPGGLPSIGLRKTMRKKMEQVAPLLAAARQNHLSRAERARLAQLERLPHDPRWKDADPDYTPPEPLSTVAPGPRVDLVDRDFTGQDLSGADLRDADLSGAVLVKTRLRGARLSGAILTGAVLYKADLTDADLTGADLTRANAAKLCAERADFTGAVLDQTFFEEASLVSAILTRAAGEYTIFSRADLSRARLADAFLYRADFGGATLEEAGFQRAYLIGSVFETSKARRVDMEGAFLRLAGFVKADLQGARFVEAFGERVNFSHAKLDGADLSWAVLTRSHFTETSAVKARFFAADLREGRFYRAHLDDADLTSANLLRVDFNKAKLARVRFTRSNLYDAKFLGAGGAGCDFAGANLKRSTLEGQ